VRSRTFSSVCVKQWNSRLREEIGLADALYLVGFPDIPPSDWQIACSHLSVMSWGRMSSNAEDSMSIIIPGVSRSSRRLSQIAKKLNSNRCVCR